MNLITWWHNKQINKKLDKIVNLPFKRRGTALAELFVEYKYVDQKTINRNSFPL